MFVCLNECVKIMCDFFFPFGNCYCYKHTVLKVENLKPSVQSDFPEPVVQAKVRGAFLRQESPKIIVENLKYSCNSDYNT